MATINATAGTQETKLLGTNVAIAQNRLDFTGDILSIGGTDTIQALKVPAGTLVKNVQVLVTTAEGATCTAKVGDGDDTDGWITSANLNSATYQASEGFLNLQTLSCAYSNLGGKYYAAADTIDLLLANSAFAAKATVIATFVTPKPA